MLSYRHAFHAGNHADVLKHMVLIECLRLLARKEKGLLVVDTHAGAGEYSLDEGYAAQNREWTEGIELVRSRRSGSVPAPLDAYLKLVDEFASENSGEYPGSPAIIARMLRPQDRAVFCELHPADHALLADFLQAEKRARVRKADGFAELKALLPPPTRRGLVFIDPSYELASDYQLLIDSLRDSLKRFAEGAYLVWYPLLEREEAKELPDRFAELGARSTLNATLRLRAALPGERGMHGSGLFVVNPPWTLEAALREALPFLTEALGADGNASWEIDAKESD